MAELITRNILFKSQSGGETTAAEMRIATFTEKEQKARAIKSLLIFWAIAVVFALIPIVHLIAVPAFLIAGVVVARRRWGTEKEGRDAEGACPACGKDIKLDLDKNSELPQWHNCPDCMRPLELQPAEANG